MEISTSVITKPILSSNSLQFWDEMNVSVTSVGGNTVEIRVQDATQSYTYTVDTTRWVFTAREVVVGNIYYATYEWAFDGETPFLTAVYVDGDLSLESGGLEFSNIRLNGKPAAAVVGRRYYGAEETFRVVDGRGGGATLRQFQRVPQQVIIRDLRGRRMAVHSVDHGQRVLTLRPSPAGAYVVEGKAGNNRNIDLLRAVR
ncbi:MAG: hypothetical protein GF344_13125 [Chitinivibrionales bacterium]|nr:hypothetical protein [Chitinivibrionales bacterium]MBD3357676.1 hypothetical protein [Chitinivibrionales bacterium]